MRAATGTGFMIISHVLYPYYLVDRAKGWENGQNGQGQEEMGWRVER